MAQEELELKRTMPFSEEAERSVIGAMITNKTAAEKALELLTPEDFYGKQYAVFFEAIAELAAKDMAIDPVTLQNRLKEKNLPPEIYGTEMIRSLIAEVPYSSNVGDYAKIVKEKATLRRLIRASEEIAGDCYREEEEMDAILNGAEKRIFDLTQKRGIRDYVPVREVVLSSIARIEEAYRQGGNIIGIPTGFTQLDDMTAGFQKTDFILIAARPSMGKTALALNFASNATFRDNKHVAIFSLEMSKESLMNRLFSMRAHIDADKIRKGSLSDREWKELYESAGEIGGSNLILDDGAMTVPEIRSKCRKFKMEKGLDLVIIDYLQLIESQRAGVASRQQEISEISRQLKALARELDVPVVALSQLSRAPEGRNDHRPMLSDLRESGAIEQDADLVLLLYRDDYYNKDSEDRGVVEVIIAKQRNGPVGKVKLSWLADQTRFGNMAPKREPAGENA